MTKFTIELEIDGDRSEAAKALGEAIGTDALQDFVSQAFDVRVESAAVTEFVEVADELTRFTVEVEVDGDRREAAEAIDDALDAGVLQDAVAERGDVTVETAVVVLEQDVNR